MPIVDDTTVLHSVVGEEEHPGLTSETPDWSAETGFVLTLITIMERFVRDRSDSVE